MNVETQEDILRQIIALAERALTKVGSTDAAKAKKKIKAAKPIMAASLPDHILNLRESGFFKQPQSFRDVHAKLADTYPCDPPKVRVALLRLQRRRLLRRTYKIVGNDKQVAYVW